MLTNLVKFKSTEIYRGECIGCKIYDILSLEFINHHHRLLLFIYLYTIYFYFPIRFWAFMDRTERHTNYPNLFRSTSLIHYLLVIFHWNGCLYHIIYKNNGFGSKNWVFNDSEAADVVKQYLQSYYWCTLALTTIGDLPRYFFLLISINDSSSQFFSSYLATVKI